MSFQKDTSPTAFGTQRQLRLQLRPCQPTRSLRRCSSSRREGCWHQTEVRSTPKKKRKEPTSEDEGSAESVHSSLTVDLSLHSEDEGEEEEEAQVEDIPIEEEEDLEKLRSLNAQSESERPARSESDKPALEEKKVEEKEAKRFPLEPTSKAVAKPKPEPKQKVSGFT